MLKRFVLVPAPQLTIRRSHSRANPHELLGVAHDATPAEIDAAYRRMALKLHPDRNPSAAAAETFKLLPDAKRRALNMARTGAGISDDDRRSEVEAQRREEMIRRAMEYKAAYRAALEEKRRRNENEGVGCVLC